MSQYWGYHCMLDCLGAAKEKITDKDNIYAFTKALVKNIDMVAHGEPVIEYFAEHDATKAGFTMMQMISTSSITAHFVDLNGSIYLDVFSCKPFNIADVVETVREFFDPQSIKESFVTRQA